MMVLRVAYAGLLLSLLVVTPQMVEGFRKKRTRASALKTDSNVTDTHTRACTPRDQDPFQTGSKVPCCSGLKEKLIPGAWNYLCKTSNEDPGCQAQWNNMACSGQFGNEECYTCGERIDWLESQGTDSALARQRVASDFIDKCGKCAPGGDDISIDTEGYTEVWSDEFNGNGAVDSQKWSPVHAGGGFGNNELQFYTNRVDNAYVSGGTLKIKAKRENFGGNQYTSAKLESRGDWLYGKFNVRARLLHGTARGTWAANWMMPRQNTYGIWPRSGEIDIMEHVGYDTGKIHGTVHTQSYHHSIGTQIGGSRGVDVKKWHTYTVEWRPDIILFACDNEVYQIFKKQSATDKNKWPFDQKFYVILNMAVGGDWGGQKGIDEQAFRGDGQIMEVDWVRVEQRGSSVPARRRRTPSTPRRRQTPAPTRRRRTPVETRRRQTPVTTPACCQWSGSPPATRTYCEPSCVNGGLGCNADGRHAECRFCGSQHWPACPN